MNATTSIMNSLIQTCSCHDFTSICKRRQRPFPGRRSHRQRPSPPQGERGCSASSPAPRCCCGSAPLQRHPQRSGLTSVSIIKKWTSSVTAQIAHAFTTNDTRACSWTRTKLSYIYGGHLSCRTLFIALCSIGGIDYSSRNSVHRTDASVAVMDGDCEKRHRFVGAHDAPVNV